MPHIRESTITDPSVFKLCEVIYAVHTTMFGCNNNFNMHNKSISYNYVFNLDSQKQHSKKKMTKAMQMEIDQLRSSLQSKTGIL